MLAIKENRAMKLLPLNVGDDLMGSMPSRIALRPTLDARNEQPPYATRRKCRGGLNAIPLLRVAQSEPQQLRK